jgi:hypothetical protein
MLAIFVAGLLLVGHPDVQRVIQQADFLFRAYQEGRQTEADKPALLTFFGDDESDFGAHSEYLLAKARYLGWIGEDAEARLTFHRVSGRTRRLSG